MVNYTRQTPRIQDSPSTSLEDVIRTMPVTKDTEKYQITVNRCPQFVYETCKHLVGKHSSIGNLAQVTRGVSLCGVQITENIPEIKELKKKRKVAYLSGDPIKINRFTTKDYDFDDRLSPFYRYLHCYQYDWVCSKTHEIADDVGLSNAKIAILVLVAGLAQSEKANWVPKRYKDIFEAEIDLFNGYLKDRAASVN